MKQIYYLLNKINDFLKIVFFNTEIFFENHGREKPESLKKRLSDKFSKLKSLEDLKELNLEFEGIVLQEIDGNQIYYLNYLSKANRELLPSPIKYLAEKKIVGENLLKARYTENNNGILIRLKEDLKVKITFPPGD